MQALYRNSPHDYRSGERKGELARVVPRGNKVTSSNGEETITSGARVLKVILSCKLFRQRLK